MWRTFVHKKPPDPSKCQEPDKANLPPLSTYISNTKCNRYSLPYLYLPHTAPNTLLQTHYCVGFMSPLAGYLDHQDLTDKKLIGMTNHCTTVRIIWHHSIAHLGYFIIREKIYHTFHNPNNLFIPCYGKSRPIATNISTSAQQQQLSCFTFHHSPSTLWCRMNGDDVFFNAHCSLLLLLSTNQEVHSFSFFDSSLSPNSRQKCETPPGWEFNATQRNTIRFFNDIILINTYSYVE